VIVQPLTDFIWMGIDSAMSRSHVNRVARIFYALKTSLDKLKSYYDNITIGSSRPAPTRYFPSITTYLDQDQKHVQFEYLGYLESGADCVTLHAKTYTEPAQDIVVKFVERYSESAHRLLEQEGLAPKLFYYGAVCSDKQPSYDSLSMVVMEYLDGVTYASALKTKTLTTEVKSELRRALRLLHDNGLVFGDLRPPNVMITKKTVKLIDFDWAGVAEQVRYPHLLSPAVAWPKDVKALDPIKMNHDLEMLDKLFARS
jgi:serine/threonine protein kinase